MKLFSSSNDLSQTARTIFSQYTGCPKTDIVLSKAFRPALDSSKYHNMSLVKHLVFEIMTLRFRDYKFPYSTFEIVVTEH